MPPKCPKCQTYHSQKKPCPADPAQSAPSAEQWLADWGYDQLDRIPTPKNIAEIVEAYAAIRTAQLDKRILDLEKFLRGVQEYDCPKQCDQKKNHHTAFCTNARALLTVAAQTPAQVQNADAGEKEER